MKRKFNIIDRKSPEDYDMDAYHNKIYKAIFGKDPIVQKISVRECLPYAGIARRTLVVDSGYLKDIDTSAIYDENPKPVSKVKESLPYINFIPGDRKEIINLWKLH
jgi:hypothetical protein